MHLHHTNIGFMKNNYINNMEKDIRQKVIVDTDGNIRVVSEQGVYVNGLHSCVVSGHYLIDDESVRNLMLLHDKRGGFRHVSKCYSDNYGYIYIHNENIVKNFENEIEKLDTKLDNIRNELEETKNKLRQSEKSKKELEDKLNSKISGGWWKFLFKK